MQLFESKQESVTFISVQDYCTFSPSDQALNHRNSGRLRILKLPTNMKFEAIPLYPLF